MNLIEEIKQIIKSEKLYIDLNSSDEILIREFKDFKDEVYWIWISYHQKLSENFIIEFQDEVDWNRISRYQILSERFIIEFQDKVVWWEISEYQKLSENFIREFQDKVNWWEISVYQKLSERFIIEFQDKVDWNGIRQNKKIQISNRFLVEIYKSGNEKVFYELKQKPSLKEYAIKIEEEVFVLFLEIV